MVASGVRNKRRLYALLRVFVVAVLVLLHTSRLTQATTSPTTSAFPPPEPATETSFSTSFLLLCLTDGSLITIDAWSGRLQSNFATDPLLQKNRANQVVSSSDSNSKTEENDIATAVVIPGLDGRLYSYVEEEGAVEDRDEYSPQIQALPFTIQSILENPVRSCPSSNHQENCGIITATAQTSLFALDEYGQLVWKSEHPAADDNKNNGAADGNAKLGEGVSLLLQRKDYWVQHVSIATGQQSWNVSLGTYQALEFGLMDSAMPPTAAVDDDDDEDDDDFDILFGAKNSQNKPSTSLPSVIFSNSGSTLTAVHPRTGDILWQQATPSVLSSVFGITEGKWAAVTVLESDEGDDGDMTIDKRGKELQLAMLDQRDSKEFVDAWSKTAWEAARAHYRTQQHFQQQRELPMSQKLLPSPESAPHQKELQSQQQLEDSCMTTPTESPASLGQCMVPESRTANIFRPFNEYTIPRTVQPNGLLISWKILELSLLGLVIGVVGLRHWYLRKKEKWLKENVVLSNAEMDMKTFHLSHHSIDGNALNRPTTKYRRSTSMPGALAATSTFPSKSDPGDLLLLNKIPLETVKSNINETKSPLLQRTESKEEQPVIQHGGIPLVRYSRYASEFEEIEAMGKGGFGSVFRCKNALDGREYAIKKISIRGAASTDKTFQQRLQRVLREVKILAVLDHPNIVRYYTAWLEIEEEQGVNDSQVADGITSDRQTVEDIGMSRCYSSSHMLSESVSQWESETPRKNRRGRKINSNPLDWDNSIIEEDMANLHHDLRKYDDFSFFERSDEDELSDDDRESSLRPEETRDTRKLDTAACDKENNITTSHLVQSSYLRDQDRNEDDTAADENKVNVSVKHTLYIQMQLCSQSTVAEFLTDNTARTGSMESGIDIPAALSLFLQISQAVQYVHDQGLIHRDLKPSNCFMDAGGNIKVGDFGLSRAAASESDSLDGSRRESMAALGHTTGVGTRSYASPEQTNASDYDASTDVYSLGIILFELCYPMYTGMERNICLSRLRQHEFPSDWQNAVGTTIPTLKDLIITMLDNDPKKRPTANDVSLEIQSILGEFTLLSLDDKHGPEMVLLRVEAEHRDDALGHTIRLIQAAAKEENNNPVHVVQYGLRSSSSNNRPTAIIEFALAFPDPKAAKLNIVSQLSKHPEIFKVRLVSRVGGNSK